MTVFMTTPVFVIDRRVAGSSQCFYEETEIFNIESGLR